MRIKAKPEDFRVEELLGISPEKRGPYALFRVEKRNLTTLEAQVRLAKRLGLPPSAIRFPALKDKVAVAVQHCTVKVGKGRVLNQIHGSGFSATLVGFLPRPLGPKDLWGNHFTVVLRDIPQEEVERVRGRFQLLAHEGLPNYFDLQRFGSWSAKLGFPGKHLLLGDWEKALWAYLAEPLAGDPPAVLQFKKVAREKWGDWKRLKEEAPRGNLRSVLTFLCDHPKEYKRAANLITPRVLSLWLSAYQSYLWNRAASLLIEKLADGLQPCEPLSFPWGTVHIPVYPIVQELREKLAALSLPLPSWRAWKRLGAEAMASTALGQVLEEEGLSPEDLRGRGLKRAYLSTGLRPLWVVPSRPMVGEPEPDELFPSRAKLTCSFALPRGSYATLFLRLL